MALTYPLSLADFADKLRIISAPFVLDEQQEIAGLGSGDIIAKQLAPARWRASIALAPMLHTQARAIQALVESLDGPARSFYLHCPTNCFPAADPGGVLLGASSVTIHTIGANNRSLRLTGLPNGYVLTAGDALAFDYGVNPVRRAWHRLAETVTASGAGLSPLFEITPPLRPGIATGIAVTLKKPAVKMFRLPGPLSVSHSGNRSVISFEAAQRP